MAALFLVMGVSSPVLMSSRPFLKGMVPMGSGGSGINPALSMMVRMPLK